MAGWADEARLCRHACRVPKAQPSAVAELTAIDAALCDDELIYDVDAHADFLVAHGCVATDVAHVFLAAKELYELGMGLLPYDDAESTELFGVVPAALRRRHPDCFRPRDIEERNLNPRRARSFTIRETGLDAALVERLQNAEEGYKIETGILVAVVG